MWCLAIWAPATSSVYAALSVSLNSAEIYIYSFAPRLVQTGTVATTIFVQIPSIEISIEISIQIPAIKHLMENVEISTE